MGPAASGARVVRVTAAETAEETAVVATAAATAAEAPASARVAARVGVRVAEAKEGVPVVDLDQATSVVAAAAMVAEKAAVWARETVVGVLELCPAEMGVLTAVDRPSRIRTESCRSSLPLAILGMVETMANRMRSEPDSLENQFRTRNHSCPIPRRHPRICHCLLPRLEPRQS